MYAAIHLCGYTLVPAVRYLDLYTADIIYIIGLRIKNNASGPSQRRPGRGLQRWYESRRGHLSAHSHVGTVSVCKARLVVVCSVPVPDAEILVYDVHDHNRWVTNEPGTLFAELSRVSISCGLKSALTCSRHDASFRECDWRIWQYVCSAASRSPARDDDDERGRGASNG